ncbi:MAG TPA: 30S ribosomal protein S8 [Chthonomonadales bacterium]|nr:30S ribosomal protein S8 [Chthonomonadales bacterium]
MAYTTDPIADLLTRIRNANRANHESVEVGSSKIKLEIVKILQQEGFIQGFEIIKDPKQDRIKIFLRYGPRREKVITNLKRVSKPGLRVYVRRDKIPRVLRGLGIAILSTSRGVMTDKQARRIGTGGEVLCYVW